MEKIKLSWKEVYRRACTAAHRIRASNHFQDTNAVTLYGIPTGGLFVLPIVSECIRSLSLGSQVVIVEDPIQADWWVDDLLDSGHTYKTYCEKYGSHPLAYLLDKQEEKCLGTWIEFPWDRMKKEDGPEDNIIRILQYLGEDTSREGLLETPGRVVKSWGKLFGGYSEDPKKIFKTFTEGACDEMVLLKNIEFYSTCEHHMLPFFGKAHIAYIPDKKVVGVSKLARLLEIFSRRLQIQERIGQQVVNHLNENLAPLGSSCILEAQHFCMTSRGVEKQDSIMVTSALTGVFKTNPAARSELFSMIRG